MCKRLTCFVILLMLSISFGVVQSQGAELPPLTELGPYGIGLTNVKLVESRLGDWELNVFVWYPADETGGKSVMPDMLARRDAPPDKSGAPYPLIIYSPYWTGTPARFFEVIEHLVSRGYVVAGTQHHDTQPNRSALVDRPLDILLMLDGLAAITDGDLAGMMNTQDVGLMGYSQGSETVLQMVGLLRDPVHFTTWCAEPHPELKTPECDPTGPNQSVQWPFVEIADYRTQLGLENTSDGLWAPFGDQRIRAVLAMAACDFPLTTEDMLAEVTTPTMLMHGTADVSCDYEGNAVRTYTYLGTEDRYLVTLVDGSHLDFMDWPIAPQHFATAFFGYYLQGDDTYQLYLTPEAVPTWEIPELAWGPQEGE